MSASSHSRRHDSQRLWIQLLDRRHRGENLQCRQRRNVISAWSTTSPTPFSTCFNRPTWLMRTVLYNANAAFNDIFNGINTTGDIS